MIAVKWKLIVLSGISDFEELISTNTQNQTFEAILISKFSEEFWYTKVKLYQIRTYVAFKFWEEVRG